MSVSALAKNNLKDRLPFVTLLVASLGYLYWRFEKLIKCPSCYLFSDGGDGLKNYFTPAYYVHHNDGLWFHGMNYPYGEHPVYTDNQPIWSLLMKLADVFIPMEQHVIGTMNMLMILSIPVAIIAVYFLLREFRLPPWYAALVSLPIVLLSPQIARLNGHYGLAYVCYLPIFLLLFVKWYKNGFGWKAGVVLILFVVATGFTHLYYFFIMAAFSMAYLVVRFVHNRLRWTKSMSRVLLMVVISGLLVYLPVKLTDPVDDRPEEVYGMYVFNSKFFSTILPWYGDWPEIWTGQYDIKAPDIESHAYLGFAPVILLPFVVFYAIKNLVLRRRQPESLQSDDITPGVLGWAGFLVWIMATGWFYLAGGSALVDLIPVLGQFRSLGRLAWIFYYAYTCFAVWFVYVQIKNINRRWLKTFVIVLTSPAFLVWVYEAHTYLRASTTHIYRHNNVFRGDKPFLDLLRQNNLAPEDFQAIFQVPMIIIGTENLPVHRGHWEFNNTLQCSWETGLPIVNYNMSRTSVSHALSLLQLISTPDIEKIRLEDMNDKPLLLTSHVAQLLPTEQRLIDLADPLGSVGDMGVYRLEISDFSVPLPVDSVAYEILAHEGFEGSPFAHALEGDGALRPGKDSVFFSFVDTAGRELQFSCWVYIASDIPGFPALRVMRFAPDQTAPEEEIHSIHSFNPWQVRGHWVEVTFPLMSKMPGTRYEFSTLANKAVIDEVIIRRISDGHF